MSIGMADSCAELRYESWLHHQEVMTTLKAMKGGTSVPPPVAEAVGQACPPCQCVSPAAVVEAWWQPYLYRGGPAATLLLMLSWRLSFRWYWKLLCMALAAAIDPLTSAVWLVWVLSTEWVWVWESLRRAWNAKVETISRAPLMRWVRVFRCVHADEAPLDDQMRVGDVVDGEEPALVVTVSGTPTAGVVTSLPDSHASTPTRFVRRFIDFMTDN